ncbi:hypothetical protein FOXG_20829 [Fusarium oxysporum f. sp. lycopersici 4287]|uniref:HAT C-terminal dimerisation domain-containing protein n=1 Tax=Fusarium oxysporum f. sp. lycopersici (strain 4287 / CBS 123668 / FGSC 9935 / NRRL 34936) TaxID=426428 RepID=A0A0J9VRG4_FUSO4|nr:hypothetical protein FOXG_20829 [Fusarium oxysporum f. sp. lycopersici 4287]KNB13488.1 hypothetical protein FOXG_20829 [Fusarium oxysporum f. sp. lycopersici 4287]
MSSENERVFSAAKLTISSQRNALHWVTVEALQCLRNWARTERCFGSPIHCLPPGSSLSEY